MAAPVSSGTGARDVKLALRMSSGDANAMPFVAGLGEELPLLNPLLTTLKVIGETIDNMSNNREDLIELYERCMYVTASVARLTDNPMSQTDLTPVKDCVEAVRAVVERYSRRSKFLRIMKASSDMDDIAKLNARIDRVTVDLGLVGRDTNSILSNVHTLAAKLVSFTGWRHVLCSCWPFISSSGVCGNGVFYFASLCTQEATKMSAVCRSERLQFRIAPRASKHALSLGAGSWI